MRIYIIRHGETALNAGRVKQGWLDEPLNGSGRYLAELTGRALRGVRFDACVSSPLIRARETAEIVLRESGNANVPVETDERLKEICFGEEEGRPVTECSRDPEAARLFFADPFRFPGYPGGENIAQVCARTQDFLKELIARDDGRTWLIGIHGCALRAMLNPYYTNPADFWHGHVPPNCSVTILDVRDGQAVITEDDRIYYDPALLVDHYRDMTKRQGQKKSRATARTEEDGI